MGVVNFAESDFTISVGDFIVYVAGVDLTPFISGNVSVTWSDMNGPNQASFTLDNAMDTWVLTAENLEGFFRQTGDRYDETGKQQLFQYKNQEGDDGLRSQNPRDPVTGERRWPLQNRSAIFNKYDPIRIWFHNPLSEEDQWMPVFAGFVDSFPISTDHTNGTSTLSLNCVDIKALLAKMRVLTNVVEPFNNNPQTVPDPLFGQDLGFFRDLSRPGQFSHILAQQSFTSSVSFLITGSNSLDVAGNTKFGVGKFTNGEQVEYDGKPSTLEDWHRLVLFGSKRAFWTGAEVKAVGQATRWNEEGSPAQQQLHFLLPQKGLTARDLIEFQFFAGGSNQYEWENRLSLLQLLAGRIDYQFSTTGMGDIVFEFPMYDFKPSDFGEFEAAFIYDKHLRSVRLNEEKGEGVSAVVFTGGFTQKDTDPLSNIPAGLLPRAQVISKVMASRIGAVVVTETLPFARDQNTLRNLAQIEFMKRLANFGEMDVEVVYRPFITPNRPIYIAPEGRMALTTTVTHSLALFAEGGTSLTLNYLRAVRPDGKFLFITGGESAPISYNTFFGTTGVAVTTGVSN